MKQLENPKKNNDFDYSKLLKNALIALVAIIIFLILIATGQIIFLLQVFGWLENMVTTITGLDVMLSKGISALLMAIILILPIGGFILSFFPVPQKNKKIKRFSVLAVFGALCIASFFASQNVFFDRETGEPLKYYSYSLNGGYNFFSSGGYDPLTGDSLRPINREVITKYLNSSNYRDYQGAKQNSAVQGLEIDAVSRFVKFSNLTEKTICLCISPKLKSIESLIMLILRPNEITIVKLLEGNHVFGGLDVSGNQIEFSLDTEAEQLITAYPSDKQGQHFFIKTEYRGVEYKISKTYSLEVLPKNDQIIYFQGDNKITLN